MSTTNVARDVRRARRWMDRNGGGLGYVPPEAFGLLVRRLAARHRALLTLVPFSVVGVVAFASTGLRVWSGGDDQAGWARLFADRALLAYAVLLVGRGVCDRQVIRAERLLARDLPHRMSRSTAVSVPVILGAARTTSVVFALVTEAALAVVLLTQHPDTVAWLYLAGFVVACGFVIVGMRSARTRPTVALDPLSLAIDERLRSLDAFDSTVPLYMLLVAFMPVALDVAFAPRWVGPVWVVITLAVSVLRIWGLTNGPGYRTRFLPVASVHPASDGVS